MAMHRFTRQWNAAKVLEVASCVATHSQERRDENDCHCVRDPKKSDAIVDFGRMRSIFSTGSRSRIADRIEIQDRGQSSQQDRDPFFSRIDSVYSKSWPAARS